uniref:EF-hand domain-containing protein n=1 Tax=Percolomonas cosmopolitus TaxID=63605 RepID=A0A6U0K7Z3_9EUKA|mmetsp:Transcript_2351/g.8795  ORF Transcript_2351/g.8795 Transcript_2351/m.8795 type:complete len:1388 (+) Transcript_2351:2551-6714(+)
MEAYQTLRAELRQHDPNNTGLIAQSSFMGTLSRFGLDSHQQKQLVGKFSETTTDTASSNVNYSRFLHYFNEIREKKRLQRDSASSGVASTPGKYVRPTEKPTPPRKLNSDNDDTQQKPLHEQQKDTLLNREHTAPPTHIASTIQKRPRLEPLSTTPSSRMPPVATESSFNAESPASPLKAPPHHNRTQNKLQNTWIPLLEVKDLSTLFDKLFSLDPKCTGSIARGDFVLALNDLNVIPRENIPRIVNALVKEERQMREPPTTRSPRTPTSLATPQTPTRRSTSHSAHTATTDEQIDYNYFIKRILDVAGSTKHTHPNGTMSTPRRDLFTATLPHFGNLPRGSSDQGENVDDIVTLHSSITTPPVKQKQTQKKLRQLKHLIQHKFYTKCNTLKEAFRRLDAENRGFVTYPQLKESLDKKFNVHVNELWMQKIFDEFDSRKQGVLYFEDIRNGLNSIEDDVETGFTGRDTNTSKLESSQSSTRQEPHQAPPSVASLVHNSSRKSVHFEPNDFEQNAQFSSGNDVRNQVTSSNPAGKPSQPNDNSPRTDHLSSSLTPQIPAVETQNIRNTLRDRMHHESDPFHQDPYTPQKNVSRKPNFFAHISSADHPLIPSSWDNDDSEHDPARDIRRDYDIARLRRYISEKALAKTDNLKDLFMYMDTNKDGRLGYDEFRAGLQALGVPPLSENQFSSIVKIADHSQNGFIEYDELCNLVENTPSTGSNVTPLENSARRRKFLTPNLSKEQYQHVKRKSVANRSKPILPNNDKIYQKMLRDMKKNGFYSNYHQELMKKFEKIDQDGKGSIPREVLKLALRESAILVGHSDFENVFDELDHQRNDAIPYQEFVRKIEDVDRRQKRQLARRNAPEFADFSLSTRQKQGLEHTLSLYAHTKRAHKDDITQHNEHLIDKKSLMSALNQLNVSLTPGQMEAVMEKSLVGGKRGKNDKLHVPTTHHHDTPLNTPPIFDTTKVVAILTNHGNVPQPNTIDTTARSRIRSESLSSITPLTPVTPTSKIQRNDETASPVHVIKQIGDKLRAKNANLHSVFLAMDKSNDGKLNASELKKGIKSLGLDVQPHMLENLLKHCKVTDKRGINFEQFAKIFRAPNQSYVFGDRRTDFVSDLIRDKISRDALNKSLGNVKNPLIMEDQFRNVLKEQNPHAPQWVIDRAVRVARSRENGKCDLKKLVKYLDPKGGKALATHDDMVRQEPGEMDFEGYHLMDTQQMAHDRAYNPRAKGAFPAQQSIVLNESITTKEVSSTDRSSTTPKRKRFSKRMHMDRYESPPVTRYWGYPKPKSEFEKEEAQQALPHSQTDPRPRRTSATGELQRNRSANIFERSLRSDSVGPQDTIVLRTAKRMSPLKVMQFSGQIAGEEKRPQSVGGGIVGRRKYSQLR